MTDSVFPVDQGEKVFVDCVDGFTLTSGDRLITCVQDAEYISPRKLPTCIIGKKNIHFFVLAVERRYNFFIRRVREKFLYY